MTDEPKEATMATEVDTRLEEALERVLIRYGVPPYMGPLVVGAITRGEETVDISADRGDFSSDLAAAARQVLRLDQPVVIHMGDMEGSLQCVACYGVIAPLEDLTTLWTLAEVVADHKCGGQ